MKKNLLFTTLTHGDELIGLNVIKKLQVINKKNKINYIISNPKAFSKNVRFIDSDLNRVFPGKKNGDYEQRRAYFIKNLGKQYKQVIDLHGTVSNTGIFIIITKLTKKNLLLAIKLDIKRIVIWTDVSEVTGSLSTFMSSGIEIECGPKNRVKTQEDLFNKLNKFLNNKNDIDVEKELSKRNIFIVFGKLEKTKKKPVDLKDWKKSNDYYPLFVDQYKDVWCYKLRRMKNKELLDSLR